MVGKCVGYGVRARATVPGGCYVYEGTCNVNVMCMFHQVGCLEYYSGCTCTVMYVP